MFTLTFTEQQMYLLNQAIGELPHKHAAPLIESINDQIITANAAKVAEEKKPVKGRLSDPQESA
ncbi:hypothetical protein EN816_00880 [Mesorhizobium sp. M8A.F.Ca.ET.173.01.1.1]|nr:hypothetical protein EN816_00880 [Mesorhizobium sp. M8A.F.Ca.ET.173.01.1.1]